MDRKDTRRVQFIAPLYRSLKQIDELHSQSASLSQGLQRQLSITSADIDLCGAEISVQSKGITRTMGYPGSSLAAAEDQIGHTLHCL